MLTDIEKILLEKAERVRDNAYVPCSKFSIGAAVLSDENDIFTGCNIECKNSISLTNCAERTAIFSAIAAGAKKIVTIAIVANTENLISPCGACRQVIAEFEIEKVIMANKKGEVKIMSYKELLPNSFRMRKKDA